jgi:cytochrome c oxidase subunit 2
MRALLLTAFAALFSLLANGLAAAQTAEPTGEGVFHEVPIDGSVTLRYAATPIAEEVHTFHNFVILPVMAGISIFVLILLVWVTIRYNAKANPVPKKFSHNTVLEVVWTGVPVLILLFIALFSFDLLFLQDRMPDAQVYEYESGITAAAFPNHEKESRRVARATHLEVAYVDQQTGEERLLAANEYDVEGYGEPELIINLAQPVPEGQRLRVIGGRTRMGQRPFLGLIGEDNSRIVPAPSITIKSTGFQWGWDYSYPDFGNFEFTSLIAPRDTVAPELYRLATTNDIVIPTGETVRLVVTARDVIHSWAMPAFGVKIDAIPGRINETWFYTEQEGVYYGQCSEICGIDHAFMPISVRAVSRPEFEAWVDEQRVASGLEPLFAADDQLAAATTDGTVN